MSRRKQKMDHVASKLYEISLGLFECMGYRCAPEHTSPGAGVHAFRHRDARHKIQPDIDAVEKFFSTAFRVVPFEYRIVSRAGYFTLRKEYSRRPKLRHPGKRSIVV